MTGWFKSSYVIMGFIATFLLFSCNEPTTNANQLVEDSSTENRSFCNPAQNSNCLPVQTHSIMLNVDGCQIKVNFKSKLCFVGTNVTNLNGFDFSIDWSNSLRCNKIGLINNALPINGIGDWTPFFTLYGDLYRNVSNAVELFILDYYDAVSTENRTLDFWESHCQKACISPQVDNEDPTNPQIPQWTFHTCSEDGCCFRSTIYLYNFGTKKWEIHARNIISGGLCQPEIPVNCSLGGSPCKEPSFKL